MIVSAAARRHRTRALAASFAQLQLPWLAPAQLRWMNSHSDSAPRTRSSARKQGQPVRAASTARAQIDQLIQSPELTESIFLPWKDSPTNSAAGDASSTNREPPVKASSAIDHTRPASYSVADLMGHYHAALRVGRLQRAQTIMHRIMSISSPDAPEIHYAYNIFFEERLPVLQSHPAGSVEAKAVFQEMEQWFEDAVFRANTTVDPQVIVSLMRGAIHAETGEKRDRLITKYVQITEEMDVATQEDVFLSSDFTPEELSVLSPDVFGAAKDAAALPAQSKEVSAGAEVPVLVDALQKGSSLVNTKTVLSTLFDAPTPTSAPPEVRSAAALARQLEIEKSAMDVAISQWRADNEEMKRIGINTAVQSRPVTALVWQWYEAMLPAVVEELELCKAVPDKMPRTSPDRQTYGPYLEMLPAEDITVLTILQTINTLVGGKDRSTDSYELNIRLSRLTEGIARALEQNVDQRKASQDNKTKTDTVKTQGNAARQNRRIERDVMASSAAWPILVRTKIGAMLISKLMAVAQLPVTVENAHTKEKITQMQPAFSHCHMFVGGKKNGVLRPNMAFVQKLQTEPVISLIAKKMPMLVPPRPWTGWKDGAYFLSSDQIVRTTPGDKVTRQYFAAADRQGDLKQIYHGLNVLGKVPWCINKDVLKAQVEAWNSGEAIANLAPLHPDMPYPPEPGPSSGMSSRRKWLNEIREIENVKSGIHSQRCFQNLQLEVARSLANEEVYFPHNLDFRGRAYPMTPYLNHMAADNARALMLFADGKQLGKEGLRWLKIHLANVAGYDKASLQEREDFAMEHIDDIRDSVHDPLGGKRWWLKSEDAWQTLAACFELVRALDSGDPESYVSHLPVHQDGTCNGLQHYAALGGDVAGARSVNLLPGDRPADIYAVVAAAVAEEVKADAAAGNEVAMALDGHITRKVVKQPVMTNVYGVTFHGAKAQVGKQLKDIFPNIPRVDPNNKIAVTRTTMAQYITLKIFKSLGTMFTGASAIQQWLGDCAVRISTCLTASQVRRLCNPEPEPETAKKTPVMGRPFKEVDYSKAKGLKQLFKSTVVWTTPLRLPVAQPYRVNRTRVVATPLQTFTVPEPRTWDPVSRRKQLQAFPPNFIHSLDASHMLLSAMKCSEAGLSFASIHDSFWTHACDIPRMSQLLREAFVAMHSEDIIGRLREEFLSRYDGCIYLSSVSAKDDVGREILAWRQDHKQELKALGPHAELAMEQQRQELLQSADPAERIKGQVMITPGSILEAHGHEDDMPDGEATALEEMSTQGVSDEQLQETLSTEDQATVLENKKTQSGPKLSVWRRLTFLPVPKKGDFDVRALKDSKYFFH